MHHLCFYSPVNNNKIVPERSCCNPIVSVDFTIAATTDNQSHSWLQLEICQLILKISSSALSTRCGTVGVCLPPISCYIRIHSFVDTPPHLLTVLFLNIPDCCKCLFLSLVLPVLCKYANPRWRSNRLFFSSWTLILNIQRLWSQTSLLPVM